MKWWKLYFAVLALLALLFPARVAYAALYTVALVYLFGGRVLRRVVGQLKVERTTGDTRLFPGETASVALAFSNPAPLPIAWISGQDHLPAEVQAGKLKRWVLSLRPRAGQSVTYSVTGRRRGIYPIGPVSVSAGDHFGLHQVSRTFDLHHQLIVYPNVYPLQELGIPAALPVGSLRARQRIYPDPSRLAGVRSYLPGDPRKSVHWKASARTGQLQVKQYDHTVTAETIILLNLNEDDYDVHSFLPDSELAIETAASLAAYLTQLGQSFGFAVHPGGGQALPQTSAEDGSQGLVEDDSSETEANATLESTLRITARKGQGHLMSVLEVLAAVNLGPASDFPSQVAKEAVQFPWGAALLLITPIDSDALINACLSLMHSGYQIAIFVTGRSVQHQELINRPPQARLRVHHVSSQKLTEAGLL